MKGKQLNILCDLSNDNNSSYSGPVLLECTVVILIMILTI